MKPEDRKRLKQHIEMIVEHKEPDVIAQENFKKLQDEVTDLREKNIKLRLELQTLRFKESQENRFVWWVYQVYARNVLDLVQSVPVMCPCDTEEDVPFIELAARIKEYTEHIYDGTYLDTAMSTEQSNSDVSMTQDVLIDIKTPQSIENTNPDYYKQEIDRLTALVERLKEDAERLADGMIISPENEGDFCSYCGGMEHVDDCPITLHRALMKELGHEGEK